MRGAEPRGRAAGFRRPAGSKANPQRPGLPPNRGQRLIRTAIILRIATLALVVLALVDPDLPLPSRSRNLVFLFDASESVGAEAVEAEREAALAIVAGLGKGDRVRALAFAGKPRSLGGPWTPGEAEAALAALRLEAPEPGQTDLGAALEAGLALSHREGAASRALVVLGDLRSTKSVDASLRALAQGGVPVWVLPQGQVSGGIGSLGLRVPSHARPGESVPLAWRLESDKPRVVTWELLVDSLMTRRSASKLGAGITNLEFSVDSGGPGFRTLAVRVLGDDNRPLPWASSGAAFAVDGAPSVLVIHRAGLESPLPAALEAQGIATSTGGPELVPSDPAGWAGLSALVLDDLPALELSASQQDAIASFVASGGGLLVVGGSFSLGRGEYFATPLEKLLPVSTDTRARLFNTRAKLLFVIDHSSSMSQEVGAETKQEAAMRGVAAAVHELNPDDEVGILGFDSVPAWVLPFTPVSKTGRIEKTIATILQGGGTNLAWAIEEGIKGFGAPGPTKRHMLVLSDGFTSSADWKLVASELSSAGITLSTIGIGDQVNETLLRGLAEATGGVYRRAEGDRVPRIMDEEAIRLTRDLMREGSFRVDVDQDSPPASGLSSAPPIAGYLVTETKALATVWLSTEAKGQEGRRDPLLASWRYGAGTVAVFASDSGARWLAPWKGRPEYTRLWSQLLRSIEGGGARGALRVSMEMAASTLRVRAEAREPSGRAWSGLRIVASDSDPGSRPFVLGEEAPGLYTGETELVATGLHRLGFRTADGPGTEAWIWYQPGVELLRLGPDFAAASELATVSGGGILDARRPRLREAALGLAPTDLRVWLLGLAALLFVLELWFRSAFAGQVAAARETFSNWLAGRSSEAEDLRRRPYMGVAPLGRRDGMEEEGGDDVR